MGSPDDAQEFLRGSGGNKLTGKPLTADRYRLKKQNSIISGVTGRITLEPGEDFHMLHQFHIKLRRSAINIALAGVFLPGLAVAQEIISYDGSTPALRNILNNNGDNDLGPLSSQNGNVVTINYVPGAGKTDIGDALGAYESLGTSTGVRNNLIQLQNGQANNIFGGVSINGTAETNRATVSGGTITYDLNGGYSATGRVAGNVVELGGGSVGGQLYGGQSVSGMVENNRVVISGSAFVNSTVYGGYGHSSNIHNNSVDMRSGTAGISLFGGYSSAGGTVSNNSVTVSGGTVSSIVTGGYSRDADAIANRVAISGGTVSSDVLGGESGDTGNATGNIVSLGGTGQVTGNVYGAYSLSGNVSDNQVFIRGGMAAGSVYGGSSQNGNAINNHVDISGGQAVNTIVGGYSRDAAATGNTVTVSGGQLASLYGGYSASIQNGAPGAASGNTITITGGQISGVVIGGRSNFGSATGNTISISGSPLFDSTASRLQGGFSTNGSDARTGNTLQMRTTGITVFNIANFERLHFYLPQTVTTTIPVLTLSAGGDSNITGTQIGVAVAAGAAPVLKTGDRVTLIHTSGGNLITDPSLANTTTAMQGISLQYDFALSSDANHLYADVTKAGLNPQTKSLLEGGLGAQAFVNQGSDLLANSGMYQAISAARQGRQGFASISGGNSKYRTGSHVNVKGSSLLSGISSELKTGAGNLTLGGFIEAGWGDYDSYNNFPSADKVKADGNSKYYGLGLLAHQEFSDERYLEASLRGGKLDYDYRSRDLKDAFGVAARYDSQRIYYGAHLGIGQRVGQTELYGQIFWTHQQSDRKTLFGDRYEFDAIDSLRSRLGGRYHHPLNDKFTLLVGAAWEHEYDGKATGKVHTYRIDSPELKGDTGVFELGVSSTPDTRLRIDAGILGYAGQRKGFSGNVRVNYLF